MISTHASSAIVFFAKQIVHGSALILIAAITPARATLFSITNLVTNDPVTHPAQITDASLKNAWGIAYTPTSPFWVGDNGAGVFTLYNVNPAICCYRVLSDSV